MKNTIEGNTFKIFTRVGGAIVLALALSSGEQVPSKELQIPKPIVDTFPGRDATEGIIFDGTTEQFPTTVTVLLPEPVADRPKETTIVAPNRIVENTPKT